MICEHFNPTYVYFFSYALLYSVTTNRYKLLRVTENSFKALLKKNYIHYENSCCFGNLFCGPLVELFLGSTYYNETIKNFLSINFSLRLQNGFK